MSFRESQPHPSQTQASATALRLVHMRRKEVPSPDRLDVFAPSGVNESHPLLHEEKYALRFFCSSFQSSSSSSS